MVILRFLLVGLAAGWIIGKIRRGEGYGVFGNLAVGTVGSFIGWFLAGLLRVKASNLLAQLAMAVAGAIVLFLLLGVLKGKKRKKSKEGDA